ncbi:AMP-binding protein [Streptomyces sp. NBC_01176]|uniref:AMP-binding protein n=1 Tax=Streptomyces sp. NBC_01176 TaxID=2903760 RepID=UPI00386A7A43|nr:AMP-binding protein [Streptomyces sp. NBC_01176]WSS89388.1 AMP-binding protein [Streptomyces sp. NBC_01176]
MFDLIAGEDHDGTPILDVVNTLALKACTDHRHRIHYRVGDEVRSLTLAELDTRAARVARHLHALGIRPRDRVGILAPNSIEWVLLDLAVIKLGAVTAGFEPVCFEPDQVVKDYGLALLFTDGACDDGPLRDIRSVTAWAQDIPSEPVPAWHQGYDPADVLAVKFTSGSTGAPKGLEATVASVNSSLHEVQRMFAHGEGDNLLVFLGNYLLQQRYWIYSALVHGHDVTLARKTDALDMARRTQPTVVMGVPGFYEEVRARLEGTILSASADERQEAIEAEFGGLVRYLWTGSAPASRELLEFFNGSGVPLYEGYGLNETCIVAKNHPGAFRPGSVGKVLPNKRVRFDRDGILIVGSRHPVNHRYTWSGPGADEKIFLPTGEVRTHDLGHLDEDGYLFIHGRVDDVITLDSGYNVLAPLIEEKLRTHPGIQDCVLYGTGDTFLSAIVSLSPASGADDEELSRHVTALNKELLPEQRVHALVIAAEPFSTENGLLTGQFKPRRRAVHERHRPELSRLHRRRTAPGTGPTADHPWVVTASRPATSPANSHPSTSRSTA